MSKHGLLWRIAFIGGIIYYIPITIVVLWASAWIAYSSNLPVFLPLLVAIIILGSILLALKWVIGSGGMLVVESLFLIYWGIFISNDPDIAWSFIFFLPALVVGILLIISWFKSRD